MVGADSAVYIQAQYGVGQCYGMKYAIQAGDSVFSKHRLDVRPIKCWLAGEEELRSDYQLCSKDDIQMAAGTVNFATIK